ncbi:MAG: hypothetical protein A3F84_01170 [Candidatus Handelsmanbacteria bacterium RIFCSPLOWO2_12_FULL_64_10]|uniref:PsbP C-terminal domain-containing protein n=1 Tax=Handelsmanbacteria sp. (strain RIFCSPLOWO2_12_FULL_64_10) TaxID=1817868 RepID=A0A1F6CR38_HANXR|nr:MAG: hypothetical protein A3F84_01170 [Candidatus Handelsmanbacteria bacterium RIFCSPLOWO2_12_FULL_64_10]
MKSRCAAALVILAGMALACARSPNSPDDHPITDGPAGRTYTNRNLGFQVTIPKPLDLSWGMSIQTLHHTGVLADGTSLSVFIKAPQGRGGFEPILSIDPFPVSQNEKLADLGARAAKDFAQSYGNYRESAHRVIEVAGGPAEQWTFRAQATGQGDRFTVTLLINGKLVYILQGSGIEGYYPTEEYESILKTFKFL